MERSIEQTITAETYFATYPETNLPMELIHGEVITMPAPSDIHQHISSQLHGFIWSVLFPHKLGIVRHAPTDIEFDSLNVIQPDIFVILSENSHCHRIDEDKRWRGAPDLCVEILSPSTAKHDLETKFGLYEQHGVREYWIIDPGNRVIQQYVRKDEQLGRHAVYNADDTLTCAILPQISFAVFEE